MSYSFNVKAANKAAAKEAMAAKFDEIVGQQPIHARDRAAALANAGTVIDLLADDDTKDITVSCNGYLSWNGSGEFTPETAPIGGVSVASSAGHVNRE
jgi:hypothetical protein